MEELKFQLVVFHPYRTMQTLIQDIKMEKLRVAGDGAGLDLYPGDGGEGDGARRDPDPEVITARMAGVTETAWSLLNDSYRLDVCLFYPPHVIAIAVINIACSYMGVDASSWFESLTFVDNRREEVKQVEEELLVLYEEFSHLKPDEIARVLSKVPIHPPAPPVQSATEQRT
mmetsp:Transcript_23471/g.63355  ORF Transcript_23471/g.63355 Transcript_23471/m.63355 type:complete len:172 (-) Transcript_23471:23-538(-)